jgi:outer membrane protein assembly factor BamE (lipoprotein component of BamABCDE complex)
MKTPRLVVALALACAALAGCDRDKVTDAIRKIRPASLMIERLRPGQSTVADAVELLGKPEMVRTDDDGRQRLDYPTGPNGTATWMLDFGADGRLVAATQALAAERIARVRPGMTQDDVRELLGKPTEVVHYALKDEDVWSWRWNEGYEPRGAMFNAHFGPDGRVRTTSRSSAPGNEKS